MDQSSLGWSTKFCRYRVLGREHRPDCNDAIWKTAMSQTKKMIERELGQ